MTIESWLLFIAVAVLPAISPGPGILLTVSNSLRYGARATIYSAAGNSIGLTVMGFAVGFGLAAILAVSTLAFTIVKLVGAAYLVYLGIKLWRDGKALSLPDGAASPVSRFRLFRQALFVSLTNPKALVLIAALIPPFVDPVGPVLPQVTILSVTYAVMCFANHLLLAFAGGRIRRFLASERRMIAVRRVLGALFIGFGAALATASR
jgi:homoserine/homoserine lactone efflux protein